jgi:asparagine synthase (glutamine-hydrolysing)
MCGIAGIIDPALDRDQGDILLDRMLGSIRHRGPDNSSVWIDTPVMLGHNRLSIIDLTDAANQPMEYDDLVIVYNGEIYNYVELKNELVKKRYPFRTSSDTEVILAAYKEWGPDCVKRFVGMWAFAIWDRTKKELFCSRDRFGIKPFYYIHVGDKFYFGSEYKPLKLSPLFSNSFNFRQIARGLMRGMVSFNDETYFECLRILPERSNLIFKDGNVSVTEHWDIDPSNKFHGNLEEKKQRFLELFRESIRLHMRSDVEVGTCLSGGLDSSSIASVMATDYDQAPFKTFSIYYEGEGQMDERPWIREILRAYPHLQPVFRSPSDEDVAAAFDHALISHDVPLPMSPPISFYLIMQLARQHGIKVMLDGQGSDEYLGGYTPSLYRLIDWSSLSSDPVPDLYDKKVGASRLKQYLHHLMFSDPLPSLLHYGDRMSMAFSIECRVPFLDHRLVEFVHSLDDEDIIGQGQTKYILRMSLAGLLPSAISARRNKQPFFGREIVSWLRGPLRWLTEARFDLERLGISNASKVQELIHAFNSGDDDQAALVWKLAGLNYWAQKQ